MFKFYKPLVTFGQQVECLELYELLNSNVYLQNNLATSAFILILFPSIQRRGTSLEAR